MASGRYIISAAVVLTLGSAAGAQSPGTMVLDAVPIRSVSIFKDGHALVTHRGSAPTNEEGNLILDGLPVPVLGTFWAGTMTKGASLRSLRATRDAEGVERPAASFAELLGANIGNKVTLTTEKGVFEGSILAVPKVQPLVVTNPWSIPHARSGMPIASHADLVLLTSQNGVQALPISSVQSLKFDSTARTAMKDEQRGQGRLTLDFDWPASGAAANVDVEVIYLQRGLRWIPNYRIMRSESSLSVIELQASVVNELADLNEVAAEFIVGVPTFLFQDTMDPLALRQEPPILPIEFPGSDPSTGSFSNRIASQSLLTSARTSELVADGGAGGGGMPNEMWNQQTQGEDQFIFSVSSLTMAKGERAIIPLKRFTLETEDLYKLSIPIDPPMDVRFTSGGQNIPVTEDPKVMHALRFKNTSDAPITTAPVLILKDGRALAQGMTTYTPIGGTADVEISPAVDIVVSTSDAESGRTAKVLTRNRIHYMRVDMQGTMKLVNHKAQTVKVEVQRDFLGSAAKISHNGRFETLSPIDSSFSRSRLPSGLRSWLPGWFSNVNPISRVTWELTMDPGETVELTYEWSYFWQE